MNQRLQQFLQTENISQSQLADTLGVARASISHIISGRNKPGFDFIESLALNYPSINLEWLITGKGTMYNTDSVVPAVVAEAEEPSLFSEIPDAPVVEPKPVEPKIKPSLSKEPLQVRKAVKTLILYSDGTFEEFIPSF